MMRAAASSGISHTTLAANSIGNITGATSGTGSGISYSGFYAAHGIGTITGSATSPPLVESLVVFGKARTLDRMRRFLETQKKLAAQASRLNK